MVWALLPLESSSASASASASGEEDKYYIFRKGTYKVGRKGCDIIINKDKGVSRIHADIIFDEMSLSSHSQVRIKDLSKYGTFVNKNVSSKKKVLHEFPNKQTSLEDDDLLSFGTGTATYRLRYIPLVFHMCHAEDSLLNHHLEDKVSSIGAGLTHVFNQECTHMLVDQHMPLQRDLLDAVVAKKPVLHTSWLEFVAGKSICTELPGCSSHVPTIMVDGVAVEVSDPKTRVTCLEGYTFLLESTYMYNFGDKLQSLLEVSGSRSMWVEDICSSSQASECGENVRLVYVIPGRPVDKLDHVNKLSLSYKVHEMALIRAVLSGNLDQSVLIPSAVPVSSCSTDETVVADSDDETATTVNADAYSHKQEGQTHMNSAEVTSESPNFVSKAEVSTYRDATTLENNQMSEKDNGCLTARKNKTEESEYGNSDILYSQVLIVRDVNMTTTINLTTESRVINYKCFRKGNIQSGNSFNSLVPFSKDPYKDYEYGRGELAESVKEEKKRQKMEAIAEELFNSNAKGRQRQRLR